MEGGEGPGSDVRMRMGGEGVSYMWTYTKKIRAYWRHPDFFSCK